jgi:hypothetical protein
MDLTRIGELQMTTTSRRAIIAGLAAAPLGGLPAIAEAFTGDPALKAVSEFERLDAIARAAWHYEPEGKVTREIFPGVIFNGGRVFDIHHLETLRASAMGMSDEDLAGCWKTHFRRSAIPIWTQFESAVFTVLTRRFGLFQQPVRGCD